MNHCSECGYDLTGLELPHCCPECGILADRAAQREAAVAWYTSWRGLLFWRAPAEVGRYLDDPRCRRVASWRAICGVAVAWLLFTGVLVVAGSLVVVSDVKIWWENPSQPGKRFRERQIERKDVLYGLDMHFLEGMDFWPLPKSYIKHEEIVGRRVQFSWPAKDDFAVFLATLPTAGAIPGVVLVLLLVGLAGRRAMPASIVAVLVSPYAAHYVVGLLLVGVVIPFAGLHHYLWAEAPLEWPLQYGLLGAVALLALGPARLLVASWASLNPRRRPPSLIARAAAFLALAAVVPLSLFAAGWVLHTM